ncbi:HEAT repeat domain-containing protein [Candidatus Woesearchaeota archaeon]|nr:HEAT repeat domain-containing protein [Candidatus Woesearchaeota archaeon]
MEQNLLSPKQKMRQAALERLGNLDSESKRKLIPHLLNRLRQNPVFRRSDSPSINDSLLTAIFKTLKSEKKIRIINASFYAADALAAMGQDAVPALVQLLMSSQSWHDATQVLNVIKKIGHPAYQAIPYIVKIARSRETPRRDAIEALIAIGPAAIPALYALAYDSDKMIRNQAAIMLIKFGPANNQTFDLLTRSLSNEESSVRIEALKMLPRFGMQAQRIMPLIVKLLRDDKYISIRLHAAEYVATIDLDLVEPMLPRLIQNLRCKEDKDREYPCYCCNWDGSHNIATLSIKLLGTMGTRAQKAVPALARFLETNRNNNYKAEAIQALQNIGTPDALLVIEKMRSVNIVP